MPCVKSLFSLAGLCLTTAYATAPLTLNDNQIVPGERVGDVEIGIPLDQPLALKGLPERTIPIQGTSAATYVFDGMTVAAHDEVYWIVVQHPRFRTVEVT